MGVVAVVFNAFGRGVFSKGGKGLGNPCLFGKPRLFFIYFLDEKFLSSFQGILRELASHDLFFLSQSKDFNNVR